jgi:hypothetical protein
VDLGNPATFPPIRHGLAEGESRAYTHLLA